MLIIIPWICMKMIIRALDTYLSDFVAVCYSKVFIMSLKKLLICNIQLQHLLNDIQTFIIIAMNKFN